MVAAWAKGVRRSAGRAKERRILPVSSWLKAAKELKKECQDGKQQTKHHGTRQGKERNTGPIKDYVGCLVELDIQEPIAHIRHRGATSFLLPIENRQKKLCNLGQ